QQIADWLEKLGMSEYAERFTENRVDFSVLRDLTDQDLKDLGVVLGDRRKILRAIANLDADERSAPAMPPMASTALPPTPCGGPARRASSSVIIRRAASTHASATIAASQDVAPSACAPLTSSRRRSRR